MLHLFIEDEDRYFRKGLLSLLSEIIPAHTGHKINVVHSAKRLAQADIVIRPFLAGSQSLCHRKLMKRKAGSVLIGIYNGHLPPSLWGKLPHCFDNSLFINRKERVETITKKILFSWFTAQLSVNHVTGCSKGCHSCSSARLSCQEFKVLRYISAGFSILQIAAILGLSTKTISTHKRAVMKKFAVKSTAELLAICNDVAGWNKEAQLYFAS